MALKKEIVSLIKSALFLKNDPHRQKAWTKGLDLLSVAEMQELKEAILQENILFKKQKSLLKLEKMSAAPAELITNQVVKMASNEPTVEDLDFSKSPEEEEEKIDKIFFVAVFALSDIFDHKGHDAKLRAKMDPTSFKLENKNRQRALENIKKALEQKGEWVIYMQPLWGNFVEGISQYHQIYTSQNV